MDNETKLRSRDLHLAMIGDEIKFLIVNKDKSKAKTISDDREYKLVDNQIQEYYYFKEWQDYSDSYWGYSVLDGENVFQVSPLIIGPKEKESKKWINTYGVDTKDSYNADNILDYYNECFGGIGFFKQQEMNKVLRAICGYNHNHFNGKFINDLRNKPMKVESVKKIEELLNTIRRKEISEISQEKSVYDFDDSCLDF